MLESYLLTVSELNAQIKSLLEQTFIQVRVTGEVSNLVYHSSGHIYFTLKDKDSVLKCVLFRGNAQYVKFRIEEGMELECNGSVTVYRPRGEYQLNCVSVSPSGEGALSLAYKQLKEKFEAKGYFKKEHKKSIPLFPLNIILVTSKSGAVLQDMLRIAQKRWNLCKFWHIDAQMQGKEAKESVVVALRKADSLSLPQSVIVLARGGGSLEDLWTFNEEEVIEAIFSLNNPLVSAIGHEPDYMLSDYVASLRAPTPSAAMEIILPDKNEWLMRLDSLLQEFGKSLSRILEHKAMELGMCKKMLTQNSIGNQIALQQDKLQMLKLQLKAQLQQKLEHHTYMLESLEKLLATLNPQEKHRSGWVQISNEKSRIIKQLSLLKKESKVILEDYSAKVSATIEDIILTQTP